MYIHRNYSPTIYFYGKSDIGGHSNYIENYHNKKQKELIRNMNVDIKRRIIMMILN